MKKLVFPIALFICFFSIGQNNFELGNYTKLIYKGNEFKYKNPLSSIAAERILSRGLISIYIVFYLIKYLLI